MSRVRSNLFLASALALFAELALIRWLGSEVRLFAYFKNQVLIACLLGFGLGFFRAERRAQLGLSLIALGGVLLAVAGPARLGVGWGPQVASQALSNFHGSILMGDFPAHPLVSTGQFVIALAWTGVLFLACLVVLYGYAQRIGGEISALGPERRLEAYSWNVLGSLLGILGFSLASYLSLPPLVWFAVVVVGTIPFLPGRREQILVLLATPLLALVLPVSGDVVWSPYHKLAIERKSDTRTVVSVNGTGYMDLRLLEGAGDRWRLPYRVQPGAREVLVVGAGAGNDAAAAVAAPGVEKIVAVEIDPEIVAIGRRLHPSAPYADPRVRVVIDDARHYVETTPERFDLIVMSHLDSHTALSSHTNVRLDNFIYTVESLRTCKRLLKPDGVLFLSFWATQDWVAGRLQQNLRLAFGHAPDTFLGKSPEGVLLAYFAIGSGAPRPFFAGLESNWSLPPAPPRPSVDDWPYLFAEKNRVPAPMLILAVPLALLVIGILGPIVRRKTRESAGPLLDRHFFFLGAGFLLVEVHNVSKLARVFGTTWVVNAWVITGVLAVILLANFLAGRVGKRSARVLYPLLITSLLSCALVPIEAVLALPAGRSLVALWYATPLLFAGLIFAASFRGAAHPARALGANVLGSVLGGFLELSSFVFGISGVMLLAAGVYLLSLPRSRSRPGPALSLDSGREAR